MTESEPHLLIKKQGEKILRRYGKVEIEPRDTWKKNFVIPDVASENVVFEAGSLSIDKVIKYHEMGLRLIHQPYLTDFNALERDKIKYIFLELEKVILNLGFDKSKGYVFTYNFGCIYIGYIGSLEKNRRYPEIYNICIDLRTEDKKDTLLSFKIPTNLYDFPLFLEDFGNSIIILLKEYGDVIREEIEIECNKMRERIERDCKIIKNRIYKNLDSIKRLVEEE